jgi:hypothetical protein
MRLRKGTRLWSFNLFYNVLLEYIKFMVLCKCFSIYFYTYTPSIRGYKLFVFSIRKVWLNFSLIKWYMFQWPERVIDTFSNYENFKSHLCFSVWVIG